MDDAMDSMEPYDDPPSEEAAVRRVKRLDVKSLWCNSKSVVVPRYACRRRRRSRYKRTKSMLVAKSIHHPAIVTNIGVVRKKNARRDGGVGSVASISGDGASSSSPRFISSSSSTSSSLVVGNDGTSSSPRSISSSSSTSSSLVVGNDGISTSAERKNSAGGCLDSLRTV